MDRSKDQHCIHRLEQHRIHMQVQHRSKLELELVHSRREQEHMLVRKLKHMDRKRVGSEIVSHAVHHPIGICDHKDHSMDLLHNHSWVLLRNHSLVQDHNMLNDGQKGQRVH
ncbi:MAG: hypothetical protein KDB03_13825 [Planctomycetales bacterium]|nr:hypothetical protein [Planctomycetales bacterium]